MTTKLRSLGEPRLGIALIWLVPTKIDGRPNGDGTCDRGRSGARVSSPGSQIRWCHEIFVNPNLCSPGPALMVRLQLLACCPFDGLDFAQVQTVAFRTERRFLMKGFGLGGSLQIERVPGHYRHGLQPTGIIGGFARSNFCTLRGWFSVRLPSPPSGLLGRIHS
jgi:hypothetical protein